MKKLVKCEAMNGKIILVDSELLQYRVNIFSIINRGNNEILFLKSTKNPSKYRLPQLEIKVGELQRENIAKLIFNLVGEKTQSAKHIFTKEHFSFENKKAYHNMSFCFQSWINHDSNAIPFIEVNDEKYQSHWVKITRSFKNLWDKEIDTVSHEALNEMVF